jgi:hypothetical protein
VLAAVGLFVAGSAAPATAADLGGDCCADLEERVAELEATAARKGNRRVSLTISGQVSTAVMAWDAGASMDPTAAKNGSISFGDITEEKGGGTGGVLDQGDTADVTKFTAPTAAGKAKGRSRDVYIVDNVPSGGTFFAFNGNAKINPKLTAGFNITIALDTGGRSHQVSQFDDDGTASGSGDNSTGARIAGGFDTDIVMTLANWYLDHKDLGRVTVGRINTATAGTTTVDLGGAGVTANAQVGYTQRGFFEPLTGLSWAALLGGNTVNGSSLSRANAISYTSPTFGGFSVAAAWGENDVWDAAIRFAGEFSGFRVAAALGYADNMSGLGDVTEENSILLGTATGPQTSQVKGSASVLHVATGLYLTGAYVNQDNDTLSSENTTLWYVQGGVSKNWTGLGNTVLYGEYAKVDDAVTTLGLAESAVWGLGLVQHIDAAAMEVFLSYRNFSADVPAEATEDFNVVMGGARIKF